jgi:hypothetical protein
MLLCLETNLPKSMFQTESFRTNHLLQGGSMDADFNSPSFAITMTYPNFYDLPISLQAQSTSIDNPVSVGVIGHCKKAQELPAIRWSKIFF